MSHVHTTVAFEDLPTGNEIRLIVDTEWEMVEFIDEEATARIPIETLRRAIAEYDRWVTSEREAESKEPKRKDGVKR